MKGRSKLSVRMGVVMAGAVASTSLLGLAASGTAAAADGCVAHPKDPSVVCVRQANRVVDMCDRDNDGHRVFGRIQLQGFTGYLETDYDYNGANSGCGHQTVADVVRNCGCPPNVKNAILRANPKISGISVCVDKEGCSAFRRVL